MISVYRDRIPYHGLMSRLEAPQFLFSCGKLAEVYPHALHWLDQHSILPRPALYAPTIQYTIQLQSWTYLKEPRKTPAGFPKGTTERWVVYLGADDKLYDIGMVAYEHNSPPEQPNEDLPRKRKTSRRKR